MDKTIVIGLSGHDEKYQLDQAAYVALRSYLDQAADRLHDDPDRADVLADLERSVGDKLTATLGSRDRVVTVADIDGMLEQIDTLLVQRGLLHAGDKVVFVAGVPIGRAGSTNLMKLHSVGEGR